MKICMVSPNGLTSHVAVPGVRGGSEMQTAALSEAMIARGHDVSVVVLNYDPAQHTRRLTQATLINAFHVATGLPGLRFIPRWVQLNRALAKADADVYFLMSAGGAVGQIAGFCRRHRRGLVFGTASNSDVVPQEIRLGIRDRLLYLWGLRRVDRIVTQHRGQAALLREHCGLNSTPIGMTAPIPDQPGRPEHPPTVLWLGNYRAVKNPHAFLDVARALPEVRFLMVGGPVATERALFETIRAQADSLNNVTFLGLVDDPAQYLFSAYALLNTSSVEGFPTTFLEAWSLAIPTVSFFDPGGIVREQEIGLIADTQEQLRDGLRGLLADRALRDRLGRRAREYVIREHSESVAAERFEREFQLAAQAHGR